MSMALRVTVAPVLAHAQAKPIAQDYRIAFHNAEPERHVLRGGDGWQSCAEVSDLPHYSAAPWVHGGALFLFSNKGSTKVRQDDLLLWKSTDDGKTWSEPVTLFEGRFWNRGDGVDCLPDGCIAQAPKVPQSFMYARPVLDGDDIAIIARSSIHAPIQHDSDQAGFLRVEKLRSLALKLTPELEERAGTKNAASA